ncbi:MAG: serine hydrolase [Brevundimonas sp.]|uniref:serine hydrolase domain-containing protein n=1 Tax=Brevundimonas sp. TaxID=1871086 RepID=UPI0025C030D2|nr:serine hydrolase [Brevundimonas sp.]MBX3478671.1 serine hydrolase [Brevundimonas sp.]
MGRIAPGAPSRRRLLAGAGALVAAAGAGPALAWPGDEPAALSVILDRALADGSTSLLVLRDGAVVAERYAAGWDAETPREIASVGKSIVAVLLAQALEDGFLTGFDQSACDFILQWRADDRRGITLRHLMSMTSGLDDTGLALRGVAGDQFEINAAAPLRDPPGARWAYNTAAYHLLFHILARATGDTVEAYAHRRLLGPLGMTRTTWITSPGVGADGPVTNYYSAEATARDLARFGRLILDEGLWEGERLISADHVRLLTSASQTLNPSYGLLWWSNALPGMDATQRVQGRRFPHSPQDTVAALGAGGQAVLIVPSHRIVAVRQGVTPRDPTLFDDLIVAAIGAVG